MVKLVYSLSGRGHRATREKGDKRRDLYSSLALDHDRLVFPVCSPHVLAVRRGSLPLLILGKRGGELQRVLPPRFWFVIHPLMCDRLGIRLCRLLARERRVRRKDER